MRLAMITRSAVIGLIALLFTLLTIPAQLGVFAHHETGWYVSIGFAAAAGVLWNVALGCLSVERGYSFWWGLLLLFPPFLLVYPLLFPKRMPCGDNRRVSEIPTAYRD